MQDDNPKLVLLVEDTSTSVRNAEVLRRLIDEVEVIRINDRVCAAPEPPPIIMPMVEEMFIKVPLAPAKYTRRLERRFAGKRK